MLNLKVPSFHTSGSTSVMYMRQWAQPDALLTSISRNGTQFESEMFQKSSLVNFSPISKMIQAPFHAVFHTVIELYIFYIPRSRTKFESREVLNQQKVTL